MRRLFILLTSSAAICKAQSPAPRPQFDVVSVKPNTGTGRGVQIGSPSPGRFRAENVWLRFLIQNAWNVKDYQIVGGPAWAASDRFNIDATADSKTTREQMRSMIQTMLEDRFQLALHHESKELPVYDLVAAPKGGIRIQVSKEGSCVPRAPDSQPPAPPAAGQSPPVFCGSTQWSPQNVSGNSISMQQFTTLLANILQHPVIDKTGFTGTFDVHLNWTPDQRTPGMMAPDVPPPVLPSADDQGPTLFTVLEEQLGLKLQPGKGPVDILVIDHAEKPSAN
jgi:uncharacterized protein (TIGR03435 family)